MPVTWSDDHLVVHEHRLSIARPSTALALLPPLLAYEGLGSRAAVITAIVMVAAIAAIPGLVRRRLEWDGRALYLCSILGRKLVANQGRGKVVRVVSPTRRGDRTIQVWVNGLGHPTAYLSETSWPAGKLDELRAALALPASDLDGSEAADLADVPIDRHEVKWVVERPEEPEALEGLHVVLFFACFLVVGAIWVLVFA